jgi:hypothetical protein
LFKKTSIFKLYVLCFILIYVFIAVVNVKADSIVLSEVELISNDVSGPGANNSILNDGFKYNGNFNYTNRNEMDKYNFLFNIGLNTQEDRISEEQDLLISRLKASISSKDNSSVFNIGDTFEYFDQYVLNSSLKGISYKYNSPNNGNFKFVFGYDYPRWENIFNDDYQAVSRKSWGMNYNNRQNEKFKWGLSLLKTNDEKGVNDNDILYDNDIYGFNWEYYPIQGLTVKGSSAYGDTEESENDSFSGTAHKIKIFSNAKEGRASIDYERVEPGFKTLLGSATADRVKYKGSLLYRYSERINYNFDYIYFYDNLDGTKSSTTYYHKPGLGVSIRHIFNRRYASTSFKYNLNKKESDDMLVKDNRYTVNYRDRFKLLDMRISMSYSDQESELGDDLKKEDELTSNISLSTRKTINKYILRPTLRFGYFNNDNETEDISNSSFEKSFELGLDIPESRINSSIRFGEKEDNREEEDIRKLFANFSFYYRPLFLEKYNQGRIYLRLKYNDLSYSENSDKDIRENSISSGITINF